MPATRTLLATACMLLACAASAQRPDATVPPPPPPKGSVTGHVICTDTQRPARFADVVLVRKLDEPVALTAQARAVAAKAPETLRSVNARTLLDGSFSVRDIPVGDYYAIAAMRGYVLPLVEPTEQQRSDPYAAFANVPVVHIAADRSSDINLSIDHGAVISGRVTYDDGSPVVGMWITALPAELKTSYRAYNRELGSVGFSQGSIETGDDGRYRLAGLPPGKYVVQIQVQTQLEERRIGNSRSEHYAPGQRQTILIYAPDSFRRSTAKIVEVKGDDRAEDIDLRVQLDGLHTVRGLVTASEDHHLVGGGWATLSDGEDLQRQAGVDRDGSVHFDYVPAGTYKLSLRGMDVKPGSDGNNFGSDVLKRYAPYTGEVIVAEHDVILEDIALPEIKPKAETAKEGTK